MSIGLSTGVAQMLPGAVMPPCPAHQALTEHKIAKLMCFAGSGCPYGCIQSVLSPFSLFPKNPLVRLTYVEFNHGGGHALPDSIIEQQLAQGAFPRVCRPNNLRI